MFGQVARCSADLDNHWVCLPRASRRHWHPIRLVHHDGKRIWPDTAAVSVARAAGVLGLHGVCSGVARSGAFASPAGGPAISHGTHRWNTTRTTVPHAFLGHTRRTTTSACTANARRERVTAVPAACDSQLHDERCSSKKPVPASRATGTPAGSVTKTSLHPQWSISTSRRLRVHARQLAVHAALEPFGLC